jgi:putative transposase
MFRDKYRIPSARLTGWDYNACGYYFVTFCTKDRQPLLGRVMEGDIFLTRAGEIVKEEILRTPAVRPNVKVDTWIVMPDHVHSIIIISDINITPPEPVVSGAVNPQKWKPGVLGSIVNQIKGVCTRRIRAEIDPQFAWQARFYDHIIRDQKSLDRIRAYIMENPRRWSSSSSS